MATAKNIRFYANGIPLHGALKSFTASGEAGEHDTTALGSAGAYREFTAGFKSGTVEMEGIWDSDTTDLDKIDDVLKGAFGNDTAVQMLASFGTVANGGPALMIMDGKVLGYNVPAETDSLIMVSASLRSDNAIEAGKFHFDSTATSAEVNGSSVDNAASSANGGYYQGHVYLESDSGATDAGFTLQHSTDNSTWADVEAQQLLGATSGAISREVTGTINRYTRIQFEGVGGKAYGIAAFARR